MPTAGPGARSRLRGWRWSPIKIGVVVAIALVAIYLTLVIHTRRLTLFSPGPPKPHVVGRFEATVLGVSADSTEICVAHSGPTGQLCGLLYTHQPVTEGERVVFVEAIVPTGDGTTTTVLIVNPPS